MIKLPIHTQPDDETCGQTCLHAVYNYYGLNLALNDIINAVERSHSGGTLAPHLGIHALENNFKTTVYVNNLDIFDPSWFEHDEANAPNLINKLQEQMKYKWDKNLRQSSIAYQQYLTLGGNVRFRTITPQLLRSYFSRDIPILTGLSATYLYHCKRELYLPSGESTYDDIRGVPCGHFVVLCGYDKKHIVVADPHVSISFQGNYYKVLVHQLINAIMLGVFTYDANLLIIEPREAQ